MAGVFRFQKFGRHNNNRNNIIKRRRERLIITTNNLLLLSFVSLCSCSCSRRENKSLYYQEQQKYQKEKENFCPKNPNLEDQNHNHHQTHQNHHQFHQQITRNVELDEDERRVNHQISAQFGGHHLQEQPPPPQFQTQNHHFYLQQESGHHFRELYSQLETQNFGPILENQQPVKKRSCLSSVSLQETTSTQDVRRKSSMGDETATVAVSLPPLSTRSALRRAGVGEIVEVQGGHIVRATGRKDRHSKVCTAKGPRDRRVRLSAHTAIQFYDVQDRLGYDRPSKAVDWLIKKAKASIDVLEKLPAWSPTSMTISTTNKRRGKGSGVAKVVELGEQGSGGGGNGGEDLYGDTQKQQQQHQGGDRQEQLYGNVSGSSASMLPPSLSSDAIADTIKSFFPMGGGTSSAANSRNQMQFQDYGHGGGLLTRSGSDGSIRQSQDLRLSLQSFQVQDPILMHSQHHQAAAAGHDEHQHQHHQQQHSMFHGASPVGFLNPNVGWAESQHQPSPELGRLQRLVVGWHNQHSASTDQHHSGNHDVGLSTGGSGGSVGGFMFNQPPLLQPLFDGQHGQFFTQRGPLQSSNIPSIRAWIGDPSIAGTNEHHQAISVHPQGLSGLGFASSGFSGYQIPARIQGEEEHDGDHKPSSVSSGSRH